MPAHEGDRKRSGGRARRAEEEEGGGVRSGGSECQVDEQGKGSGLLAMAGRGGGGHRSGGA
jgi:hypothetical protein